MFFSSRSRLSRSLGLLSALMVIASLMPVRAHAQSSAASADPTEAAPAIPLIKIHRDNGVPIEDVDTRKDIPARTVFFELNPVDDARSYDIQVKALTEHWAAPYTAELEGTTLRLRLTPGQYKMRTRSKIAAHRPGKWGPWKEFWVHFRMPSEVFPSNNMTIVPKGNAIERVTFEWPKVDRARFYLFSLYDTEGKLLRRVRTEQTWLPIDLSPNSTYAWSVVPLAARDEPEPEVSDTHQFRIGYPNGELRTVVVNVEPKKRATSYDFEFLKFVDDHKTGEPTIQNSKEANYRAALSPGEYEMRARTNYEDGSHSNWGPPQRFWVRVANPEHVLPVNNAKIDPTDEDEAEVRLKWKPARDAKTYHVFVWDERDKLVDDEITESHALTVGLPHNAKYKWSVTALLDREKRRGPASTDALPADTTSFEIEKYKRLGLNSAEEPSQFYAWGRYLTSNIAYKASNYDNNTRINQTVFGGTGELAGGYWHRKSDFGLLAAASSSGFRTEGKTYTYNYGSLLLGYRLKPELGTGRWRFWLGMGYKETPEILKQQNEDVHFSKIRAWTPETRVSYLGEFSKKMGYQIYGSYLTSVSGIETVNDRPLKNLYQVNLGVYGTYRFSDGVVGMMGYSYQIDSASYASADEITHGTNEFSFAGHYLSFTLQIGLEKAQR